MIVTPVEKLWELLLYSAPLDVIELQGDIAYYLLHGYREAFNLGLEKRNDELYKVFQIPYFPEERRNLLFLHVFFVFFFPLKNLVVTVVILGTNFEVSV